jgi:hypothetical protein
MYPLNNFMGGIIFFVIWLLLMLGIISGWIIFLVAIWRGMKAHESIAESMKELASRQEK